MQIAKEDVLYFSQNEAAFVEFKRKHLVDEQDALVGGCRAAMDLVLSSVTRYDNMCNYVPEILTGVTEWMSRDPIDRSDIAKVMYFFTACVREVTSIRKERSLSEQAVLDAFRSNQISSDGAWGNWYRFYEDFIFNLMPLRLAEVQFDGIRERRKEIAQLHERVDQRASEMDASFDRLKSDLEDIGKRAEEGLLEKADALTSRIDGYRAELEKIASNYNFVGLSNAFKELMASKAGEVGRYLRVVVMLGLIALLAPVVISVSIGKTAFGGAFEGAWSALAILKVVGLVGFELLLLYYFRISLKSFLLLKDQQENLSLRLALCQFIEGYCEFSESAAKRGVVAIHGFESLIFSPLPTGDSSLPPTLDGIESIAKILSSIKK